MTSVTLLRSVARWATHDSAWFFAFTPGATLALGLGMPHASVFTWSGTARRLLLGFGALVLIFGVASYFALAGLARIHTATAHMKYEEEGVRLSLELASAVRDQYAHQAHTIIIGDDSHLGFYAGAERHVLALTRELRQHSSSSQASSAGARAEVDAVERRTYRWIVALLVGAPLLAAAVSLAIGRSIARPMARLEAGAARLAAGDLETRIDITTPDEFGALARQFNAMTQALKDHQDKLVQGEKLAGIGRLAAGVAHEINNPLGVILGYTRLLKKRADGPLSDDLAVIEEETLRCKEIVEGLLDLSRPVRVEPQAIDLRATTEEVVARLHEAELLNGVEVLVSGAGAVEAQPSKLRQVLANLVRNAAEAAGAGGAVQIWIDEGPGGVQVSVRDSGPGLDGQAMSRIFEPFFTTKDRGTGLGLAISRAIARAHGGDIEAVNSPYSGAEFTLHLPRRPQGVAA